MDLSAFTGALTPYVPANQKEQAEKMTAYLSNQSKEFSQAVSLFACISNNADRDSFLRSAKKLDTLYDSGLVAACRLREMSRSLTSQYDPLCSKLKPEIVGPLDAVEADEAHFAAECTSDRAVKAMKKTAAKMQTLQATTIATSSPPLATVSISSVPASADVEVDGKFVGNTPSSLSLPTGEHTVRIVKKGFKPWERKLTVSGGSANVSAELEPDK